MDLGAIETANAGLLSILDKTAVRLIGVRPAATVTSLVGRRRFLHAGPPLDLQEMAGPMRAALAGALVLEGEASSIEAADALIAAGEVEIAPCHSAGGVGAMAGIVGARTPVIVVETSSGRRAFAPLNEGLGKALRYGNNDEETLKKMTWLTDVAGPLLDRAIAAGDPIDIRKMQADVLKRGDECHNRNPAGSGLIVLTLAAGIIDAAPDKDVAAAVVGDLAKNPQFFLSFSMAAAKAIADDVHATGRGSIVTAIAFNGVRAGIRVSGAGDRWFTTPAPLGEPKLRAGFTLNDACPAMGDSGVTETIGLGALAFSAAPAMAEIIGEDPRVAPKVVAEMRRICVGESSIYRIPAEGFRGTPIGIDVMAVCREGITPVFSNGVSCRRPGVGVIGASLTRVPAACFEAARAALADQSN